MITRSIFPGRHIQGLEVLRRLPEEIERFADMRFIVYDPFVLEDPLSYSDTVLSESSPKMLERFRGVRMLRALGYSNTRSSISTKGTPLS